MDDITIEGLRFVAKNRFDDERGNVLHMLREADGALSNVHEVYLSTTVPGAIKAWKRHKRMLQHHCVAAGKMEYVVYDDRDGSPTKGTINRFALGPDMEHGVLIIPPMLWYGFRCLSDTNAVIVNAASMGHDPEEIERLPEQNEHIPFRWDSNAA